MHAMMPPRRWLLVYESRPRRAPAHAYYFSTVVAGRDIPRQRPPNSELPRFMTFSRRAAETRRRIDYLYIGADITKYRRTRLC